MKKNSKVRTVNRMNSIGMFDFCKGILMLLVIGGHSAISFYKYWEVETEFSIVLFPLIIGKFFLYGAIPLFFFINGFGFRKQKIGKCILDRFRYLSKPYMYVAISVTLLAMLKKVLLGAPVLDALKYQGFPFLLGLCPGETEIFGWYTSSIGPMWFLVSLGIARNVLDIIYHLESEILRGICVVAIVAACTRLPFYAFIPFCFVQSLCCVAYMYLGYQIKLKNLFSKPLSKQAYVVLVSILLVVIPFGNIDVSQNVWKLGFLDFVASCIAGFLLGKLLFAVESLEWNVFNWVRKIGRCSLIILCVHTVEYLVFPWEKIVARFEGHTMAGIFIAIVVRGIFIGIGCFVLGKLPRIRKVKNRV